MKYLVELKYTNPSHEHVSLRRRVESVTRLVEARNEGEAVLRASNQQRSLGFMIREAKVVKEKSHDKEGADETMVAKGKEIMKKAEGKDEEDEEKDEEIEETKGAASYPLLKKGEKLKSVKLNMKEGFDPEPSDIAAQLVKKHGKGKVTKDHVDAYERDRDSNKAIDKEAVMKHVQKMSENVEQVDEQSPAEIKAKYYHDQFDKVKPVKAYDKDGKLVGHYRSMAHAKQMKPGHTYKVEEDIELDEAQKKLKPSYWKAEWRLGTQSEVDKNNKKIFDKLAKTDPVKASAFHDNLMRMRKKDMKEEVESIDEGVATAQKVMDRANVVAKTNPDPKKRFAAGGLANKAMMRTINPTGVNTGITRGGGNKAYRKITGKAPPHQLTPKTGVSEEVVTEASKEGKDVMRNMRASLKSMDLRHGVDSDKREAGYKMSPAVKAAQAKSDALSKVVKRPQAGTLAAKKIKEAAEKMVKKARAIKDDKKSLKAAEVKQEHEKKKVNKINMEPSVEVKD